MVVESSVTEILPAGAPCWVELATSNDGQMSEFYHQLLGWEYRVTVDSSVATDRYAIAMKDGFPVAGLYQTNGRSGWIPHVAVSDINAGAERVGLLGGAVTLGPVALPHDDSVVYAQDPVGAPIALRCPPPGWLFTSGDAGSFAMADLNTRDGAVVDEFYANLLGYTSVQLGDGTDIDYAEWQLSGRPVLHRYVMGPEYAPTTPPHWLIYFVANPAEGTDATAVRALSLGGGIAVEPYDSRLGRATVLTDPGGATFGVIDYVESLENRRAAVEDPDDE
jgi:predicted enzyme related to lactoylglutathione lyase